MKIKIKEGYFRDLDMDNQEEPIHDDSFPKTDNETKSSRSEMDQFLDYCNHSRSPLSICADGRVIKPNLLDSFISSFKKSHPSFDIQTEIRKVGDESFTYVLGVE